MSFILDALKKADAERRSATLPDLHSAPDLVLEDAVSQGTAGRNGRMIAAAIALLAAAGLIVIATMMLTNDGGQTDKTEQAAASKAEKPVPIAQAPRRPTDGEPSPGSATQPPTDRQSTNKPPLDDLPVPPSLPKAAERGQKSPSNSVKSQGQPGRPEPSNGTNAPPVAAAAPAAKPGSGWEQVPLLAELPDPLRREIPDLAVTGSMYSDNPANRMVLINRRLLREGDEVAPGIAVEYLAPRAAILKIRNQRFRLPY